MADTASRIWYQSFVDERDQAAYVDRLRGALAAYADPGFEFAVHGISPPDRSLHPLTEFRCAGETIRAALTAQADGCDAFVIGHFQEPGLIECRGSRVVWLRHMVPIRSRFPFPRQEGGRRRWRPIVKRGRRPEGAGNATRSAAFQAPRCRCAALVMLQHHGAPRA